ncbi:SGNH/GDSL hydrolase family protein [Paenibacillus sp. JX-17]|uniref:SGNH/GDSL hydrolase family protein n=1 Tax=Paenibacillus lacisoli TaxID=3064525 RepID=A0ABT9CHH7_9BACL|nr:SGNH/GDSL hydrolase family protein [Paenibacillus sp. JX-17]MDO7907121.1 SGNH/GDSL hydrolase family protein [Paenibacillus sp. JX-17]
MSAKGTTILFQGDSITDGGRSRNDDPNHFLGHGYAYIIAARLGQELADQQPVFLNRGVSGDRASDLYARWNEDCISHRPDLLSILVGVNDAWRSMNGEPSGVTDRFERAYRHLLQETREVLPETGLVLCEPFILRTGATEEKWEQWQERVGQYQEATKALAAEFGAVFVPLQDALNQAEERAEAAYWLWDGVHPTAAGHELIAGRWLEVVQGSPLAIRS